MDDSYGLNFDGETNYAVPDKRLEEAKVKLSNPVVKSVIMDTLTAFILILNVRNYAKIVRAFYEC